MSTTKYIYIYYIEGKKKEKNLRKEKLYGTVKPFFQDHADSQMEVALKLINKRSVVLVNEFFYIEVWWWWWWWWWWGGGGDCHCLKAGWSLSRSY